MGAYSVVKHQYAKPTNNKWNYSYHAITKSIDVKCVYMYVYFLSNTQSTHEQEVMMYSISCSKPSIINFIILQKRETIRFSYFLLSNFYSKQNKSFSVPTRLD